MPATIPLKTPVRKPDDPLVELLCTVRVPPKGVPAHLWQQALAGPVSEFLSRPGKRFRGMLACLSWKLVGRQDHHPPVLPLIVELLHAGSLVIDDIQDGSVQRRGKAALHRSIGMPLALNVGNWLYFWPLTLLAEIGVSPDVELRLHRSTVAAVRRCHEGQALDLTARIGDLHPSDLRTVCRTISEWKTGSLMGLAGELGAVAAGGSEGSIAAATTFGVRLGVALQMLNDLSELTGVAGPLKHPEDLIHGRVTWPWVWAAERLSAPAFEAIQDRGAKLAAGTGSAATLAAELLDALGPDPKRPIADDLSSAFGELAMAVGPHPALSPIRAEVDRLLQKYF